MGRSWLRGLRADTSINDDRLVTLWDLEGLEFPAHVWLHLCVNVKTIKKIKRLEDEQGPHVMVSDRVRIPQIHWHTDSPAG